MARKLPPKKQKTPGFRNAVHASKGQWPHVGRFACLKSLNGLLYECEIPMINYIECSYHTKKKRTMGFLSDLNSATYNSCYSSSTNVTLSPINNCSFLRLTVH